MGKTNKLKATQTLVVIVVVVGLGLITMASQGTRHFHTSAVFKYCIWLVMVLETAPLEVVVYGIGGSSGIFAGNLLNFFKVSVLAPVVFWMSLGRQLNSLGSAQMKLSAFIENPS